MRTTLLKFLLPILLLIAQQTALAHEFSHLSEALGEAQRHGSRKQLPGEAPCEKCVAFAHLSSAVRSEVLVPLVEFRAYDHSTPFPAAELVAETLSPRSRGPPVIL